MVRTKVILVLCFAAAFAAGGTAGYVVKSTTEEHPHGRSWLMAELKLTDPQREQMRDIWSSLEGNAPGQRDQRRVLAEERDKAIAALLTGDQQSRYEQIKQDYERKTAELSAQRRQRFDQAVERTKQILTPEQAKQYEKILKDQRERGGGPRSRGGSRTRPAIEESNAPHVGE